MQLRHAPKVVCPSVVIDGIAHWVDKVPPDVLASLSEQEQRLLRAIALETL